VGKNFYFSGTIFGLGCTCDQMRHEFAPEVPMSTFPRVEHRRPRPEAPIETEERLPLSHAAFVIAGLSALCWAVLIVALRAVL